MQMDTKPRYCSTIVPFFLGTLIFAVSAGAADRPGRLPPDPDLAAELLDLVGDGFSIQETDHFTIAYDTDRVTLTALTGRAEGTFKAFWEFCDALGVPVHPPERRMGIVLFDSYENYARHCAGAGGNASVMAGFYDHRTNLASFCNMLAQPALQGIVVQLDRVRAMLSEDLPSAQKRHLRRQLTSLQAQLDAAVARFNRLVIQHEVAHQVGHNIGVHVRGAYNPPWFVEGLACQFEVAQSRSASGVARTNHARLADFRSALGLDAANQKCTDQHIDAALEDGRLIPLRQLVSSADVFAVEPERQLLRYAQAWSLVYYLQRERRAEFAQYVQALARRTPDDQMTEAARLNEFEQAFGPVDRAMERDWLENTALLRFNAREAGR